MSHVTCTRNLNESCQKKREINRGNTSKKKAERKKERERERRRERETEEVCV